MANFLDDEISDEHFIELVVGYLCDESFDSDLLALDAQVRNLARLADRL